jgi:hypothetical protein
MSSLSSRSRRAVDPPSSGGLSGGGGGNSDIEQGGVGSNNYYRRDHRNSSKGVTSSSLQSPPPQSSSSFSPQRQQQQSSSSYSSPFRKFLHLLTRDIRQQQTTTYNQATTTTQRQRIIIITLTLIKDTLLGSLLGIFCLLTLFYLDYTNLISIGSTHAFQKAGVQLLSDPTVITTIEHSLQIKLLPRDTYDAMKLELSQINEMLQDGNEQLNEHTTKATENNKIKNDIQKEYDGIQNASKKLGLDKWCGECREGFGNCNVRVEYLKRTYGTGEVIAKMEIMKQGKCVKK